MRRVYRKRKPSTLSESPPFTPPSVPLRRISMHRQSCKTNNISSLESRPGRNGSVVERHHRAAVTAHRRFQPHHVLRRHGPGHVQVCVGLSRSAMRQLALTHAPSHAHTHPPNHPPTIPPHPTPHTHAQAHTDRPRVGKKNPRDALSAGRGREGARVRVERGRRIARGTEEVFKRGGVVEGLDLFGSRGRRKSGIVRVRALTCLCFCVVTR